MFDEPDKSPIFPGLRYNDAAAAIEWLCDAFGFEKRFVVPGPDDSINHAQLTLGDGMVMVGTAFDDGFGELMVLPNEVGGNTQSLYIYVADVDAHYEHAKAAGAEIVIDLADQEYGVRLYVAKDPEGYVWTFGSWDPWTLQ